jgi:20S proteasome subunit beta 7
MMAANRPMDPRTRTSSPIVTGTSVLGMKYDGGVLMVADMLGSYGSMARFKDIPRLKQCGDSTVVGAGGDLSDFQYIQDLLEELMEEDAVYEDGVKLTTKSIHSYVSRVMYNRRSKMDPLWNSLVVGGYSNGQGFLATCDLMGTQFEDDIIATGYGGHLALPLMREAVQKWGTAMTLEQAQTTLENCMRVLWYRDCRASNKMTFAKITEAGVEISPEPVVLSTEWQQKKMVHPGGHDGN